jgi:signal transduction histidine kinase
VWTAIDPLLGFVFGAALAALAALPLLIRLRKRLDASVAIGCQYADDAERARAMVGAVPDGVMVFDRASGQETCSRRLKRLVGFEASAEVRFANVLARFAGDGAKALGAAVAALRRDGTPFALTVPLNERHVQAVGTRAHDSRGQAIADVLWLREVAAPAPAAATIDPAPGELLDHDVVGRDVLELLPIAVAIFDAVARLQFFNAAYAALWRLDPTWLAGEPLFGDVLEQQRARRRLPEVPDFRAYKKAQLAIFADGPPVEPALMHLPDGTTLRVRVRHHAGGGLIFVYEDVSDRLELERSLKTVAAVQGTTLDRLHEGVAVFGSDGRLKLWNPVWARLWSLSPEQLSEAFHVVQFIDAMRPFLSDIADWNVHRERVAGTLMSRAARTGRLIRNDGTVLDYANVPLPDGAMLLSYLDVTDSVRVETALRERAEAFEEASRLKSQFIANVSYEIRTPLNAIIGFAEMLNGGYFGELNRRQREYSQGIFDSARGLMTVVGDILDLASIEAGALELERDAVDVHAMLVSVFSLIRERARRKDLHLEFDCSPDIGWINGDEARLKQVLFHLLSNAVAFTPARGGIRLSAGRDDDSLVLAVADTGIGIPLADQERVLRPFERGPRSLRPDAGKNGGAGLGLTLVKKFVELHGGTMTLKSVPNRGTTVTCRLPAGGAGPRDAFQP